LESQNYANSDDAMNAAADIAENISDSGGGGDSGGVSLTNKRNVGGVNGFSIGVDGVDVSKNTRDGPFSATLVIDVSVPKSEFSNISLILENDQTKDVINSPTKTGEINGVDGFFLRSQDLDKSWYKISNYSEATITYDPETCTLKAYDSTGENHPIRLSSSYYVNWVPKTDKSRSPKISNPFNNEK